MDLNHMNDIDRFIEEALRSEPLRPVPSGFHARVNERLRVAALASSERRGFQSRMAASVFLVAVIGFAVVCVPTLAFYQGWTAQTLPGAMGYFDYLVVFAIQSWGQILIAAGAGAAVLALAAFVWLLVPIVRKRAAHQQ